MLSGMGSFSLVSPRRGVKSIVGWCIPAAKWTLPGAGARLGGLVALTPVGKGVGSVAQLGQRGEENSHPPIIPVLLFET